MGATKTLLRGEWDHVPVRKPRVKKQPKLPTYATIEYGRDAYVPRVMLSDLLPHAVRYWKVNGRLVSVQLKGGGVAKPLDCFPEYANNEGELMQFLDDCLRIGVVRPSSYSDLFAQRYRSPRVLWTYNSFFADWFAGGWEQARQTGILPGSWNRYDLNSAYLWALTKGLPDVRTFRFTRHIQRSDVGGVKPGLYLITLHKPRYDLPYPFNTSRKYVVASSDELEAYDIDPMYVHSGITYKMLPTVQDMVDLIYDTPCPKLVARTYWGRWVSKASVFCHAPSTGREWPIRNPILNVAWAHLIVSRVKLRLWQDCPDAAHVFVDSVITLRDLPVGRELGSWRLEERYLDGVQIRGPGIYGTPSQLQRHAGARRG